jgi:hypothetical protein
VEVKLDENPFDDKKFIKCLGEGKWKSAVTYLKKASGNVAPVSQGKMEVEKKLPIEILSANSKDEIQKVFVTDDVEEIRPYFCGCIIRSVEFTQDLFDQFIDLQTGKIFQF